MIIEGEKTFFGENISTAEEFIEDMCERMDKMYAIVMDEKNRMLQLKFIMGFLSAFKGRLNRVCEKPNKIFDYELICKKYIQKGTTELTFGGETYLGEIINTPEKFIEDFCNRIDVLYAGAMKEVGVMNRLAYSITSLIVLKGKLNRVCEKI